MYTGINIQDARQEFLERAVKRRWSNIHIPVFILQGINDSLFPANQAIEAYNELTARGIPTRLYLGGIGHPPAVGNGPEIERLYDEVVQWFDKYLKGKKDKDTPLVSQSKIEVADAQYFNNVWDGNVRFANTFARPSKTYYLNATSPFGGTLSPLPALNALPIVLTNAYAGSGLYQEAVTSEYLTDQGVQYIDTSQIPGTVTFETPPLPFGTSLDLAGIPKFNLTVTAADQFPVGAAGLLAAFQLDPKIWDVDPAGNAKLITRGAYSEQIDANALLSLPIHTVNFDIYATFYRFQAGHKLRITLATEDVPYLRPTVHPFVVTIYPGSSVSLATGEWLSSRVQVRPSPEVEATTQRSVLTAPTLITDLLDGLLEW
jgi:ABC-2 type transport system ATP-binding protein